MFNICWTKCYFSFQKQSKKYTTTSDISFFFSFCFHCRFCSNSVNSNVFSFYMLNLCSGKFMMGLNASNNIVIGFNNFLPLLTKKAPKCDGAPTIFDNSAASIPSSFFVQSNKLRFLIMDVFNFINKFCSHQIFSFEFMREIKLLPISLTKLSIHTRFCKLLFFTFSFFDILKELIESFSKKRYCRNLISSILFHKSQSSLHQFLDFLEVN